MAAKPWQTNGPLTGWYKNLPGGHKHVYPGEPIEILHCAPPQTSEESEQQLTMTILKEGKPFELQGLGKMQLDPLLLGDT